MLVGTTFALMTTSVKSKNNRIVAGNLDVEVNVYDKASKSYKPIGDNSLFDVNELWEPDTVKVAYIEIKNMGSLAVDYSLEITMTEEKAGINGNNQNFLLSDYLVFNVVEIDKPDAFYKDSQSAKKACENIRKGFNLKPITNETPFSGGTNKYYAVIVYMPSDETVDNANYIPHGKPVIQLNVSLSAKQSSSDKDIFNEEYDKNSQFETATTETVKNNANKK